MIFAVNLVGHIGFNVLALLLLVLYTLLEINGITLIKKWYNPVASWYTIYGITKKNKCYTI